MAVLNGFRRARGAEFRHGERKGCLKNTREAVLTTIELWARDFDKSSVYWLNGLAGTGKSTIVKTIADRLFADDRLGASFFCSRDFEDRRDLHFIFPTLATQLARKFPEFRKILVRLIESDPDIAYESLYSQMEKLIVRPLSETSISTVVVIDALDECKDEQSSSAILFVLGELASKIPKIKFFLTGRPEPRISEGFRDLLLKKMADKFVLHGVERDQVNSDIRLFFATGLSEIARRRGLDNWPTESDLDRLCSLAAGLFVYAAATVKFVDNNKWDPRKRLNNVLWSKNISGQEGKTLDLLYTTILQEAFHDGNTDDNTKMRSVLGAVVLATNPLSPSAISRLLGLDAYDVPPLLSSVNSLLILHHDPDLPVRAFHKSFPDFITDPQRCTDQTFHIFPPHHHSQLLIRCLGLMDGSLKKNMCKLQGPVANSEVGDLRKKIDDCINPTLQYACVSWHAHLVETHPTPQIDRTLKNFMEKKFLFWLEVLSVLGAVRNAAEAMRATVDWLKVCQVPTLDVLPKIYSDGIQESPTLELADDCFYFVTTFFEVIKASAPHIYHSALVMAPKKSIVRKLYKSDAHPFVRVVHGLPTSWHSNFATKTYPDDIELAGWSTCNRFIAITSRHSKTVEVLDSATLQRLQTLEFPRDLSLYECSLVFSPDSRILTCSSGDYKKPFVVSWDLQTGGVVGVIRWQGPESDIRAHTQDAKTVTITYSADGKMVGVFYCYRNVYDKSPITTNIYICDVASGVYMHSHSLNGSEILLPNHIWTHGESLQFVTARAATITIWEVGFTSSASPIEVETLPIPDGLPNNGHGVQFLPDLCRLAFFSEERGVRVWDARNSKCLLDYIHTLFLLDGMSFSSDGCFFACSTMGSEIYLWKESPPNGYILHEILVSNTAILGPLPFFSRTGNSIVTLNKRAIQLWHITHSTTPTSSTLTQAPQSTEGFVLDVSPDETLAVVAMWKGDTVTVLNLKSGGVQLTIDPGMEVYGLRVTGNTVGVIGLEKAITWNLPARDSVPDARMNLEGSARTIELSPWDDFGDLPVIGAAMSSDFRYIALNKYGMLRVYSASAGELLGEGDADYALAPWFSPDGCNVWCVYRDGWADVFRIDGEQNMLEPLERRIDPEHPPEGYPWGSSRYRVTEDSSWWLLGPGRERLLMLPPSWRSEETIRRVWRGEFLALLHSGLSEPVILELNP